MRNTGEVSLDIIVPVHNEVSNVEPFLKVLHQVVAQLDCKTSVLFVNDGSQDGTLEKLIELQSAYRTLSIVSLSRNFGKEAALTAGLEHSKADICIPIDADLQHPPELILDMLQQWREGSDHVVAVRQSRQTEGFLKKTATKLFYKLFNAFGEIKIPNNAGDYRLLGRPVVDRLLKLREKNRFMKGLYVWVGGAITEVAFEPNDRSNDESSFNLKSLFRFSLDAITSFTTLPLRLWSFIGFFICLMSGGYGVYLICKALMLGVTVPGYTTLMVVILFFGGIQLVSLGIIGEYLSRLFIETKRRPIYLVDQVVEPASQQQSDLQDVGTARIAEPIG